MATILFVHGIWVRPPDLLRYVTQITKGLGQDHKVKVCEWGATLGTPFLPVLQSIPRFRERHGEDKSTQWGLVVWDWLYQNPYYELRELGERNKLEQGDAELALSLRSAVLALDLALHEKALRKAEIWDTAEAAYRDLLGSEEYKQATERIIESEVFYRQAIARAFVAKAMMITIDNGTVPAVAGSRDLKENLINDLVSSLGGWQGAVAPFLLEWIKRKVLDQAVQNFGSIGQAAYLPLGDIMQYQGPRGQAIRDKLEAIVQSLQEPVILLGHSLGGIACFEMLIEACIGRRSLDLAKVRALVTVGSQCGVLYELDALQTLRKGPGLPSGFPQPWINLYDESDLLSFVVHPFFPGKVKEFHVPSGAPFPESHSAYWVNPKVWQTISEVLA